MKRCLMLTMMGLSMIPSFAQKVDFNLEGRQPKQVTANGYMPWAIRQAQKETKVIDAEKNIKLTIEPEQGDRLACVWWKDGVQRHDKLVGDALGARKGIKVTVSGLSAGTHSLLAYQCG